jgi:hypothetical protein
VVEENGIHEVNMVIDLRQDHIWIQNPQMSISRDKRLSTSIILKLFYRMILWLPVTKYIFWKKLKK